MILLEISIRVSLVLFNCYVGMNLYDGYHFVRLRINDCLDCLVLLLTDEIIKWLGALVYELESGFDAIVIIEIVKGRW